MPRSLAVAAKVLLAALFCCPAAGSLRFVMTTGRWVSYSPLGWPNFIEPELFSQLKGRIFFPAYTSAMLS